MGLLSLPSDILFHHLFTLKFFNQTTLAVCRMVCTKLRGISSRGGILASELVASGSLKLLKHLCVQKYIHSPLVLVAAKSGHLLVLQWLIEIMGDSRLKDYKLELCRNAANNGHLPIIRWLAEKDWFNPAVIIDAACKHGRFNVIEWFLANGGRLHASMVESAIIGGNFDMFDWLYQRRCPEIEISFRHIAKGGSIKIAEFFYDRRPLDSIAVIDAAMNNHFLLVKWFIDKGLTLEKKLIEAAILNRNKEMLLWLLSKECPYNKAKYLKIAIAVQNTEIISIIERLP